MSTVEHYFENLLFHGHDIKGEPNKNALSKEVQDAVEQCANYIKYTYKDTERKIGKWEQKYMTEEEWIIGAPSKVCPFCHNVNYNGKTRYCPHCGEEMEVDDA